jgi:hypothetical protein
MFWALRRMMCRFWFQRAGSNPWATPRTTPSKYFALVTLEDLKADLKWNARVRQMIYGHWRMKNAG